MELDELFETKRYLENKIENFFDGEQKYTGDRNYQSLLERLEEVEEQIKEILEENDFSIESAQAKLRNKLGPFWTLSELISNEETFEKLLSSEVGKDILIKAAKQCQLNKDRIIELIKITEQNG
jgi:regulator of replication initiation timing